MSMAMAAMAAGSGMLSSRRSRKRGDSAADDAAANTQLALGQMEKGIDMIDALQPAIDNFARMGNDNYERYKNMAGPMEDSLQDYYMGLDPDELAAQGNQTAQQQYQNTMNQVNDQLAAQGIGSSGMEGQMGMQYGNQMAQTKTQNIMNSPHQVAQQQQGWLGYTGGQQTNAFNQMQQGVNMQQKQGNAYQQAYGNMANLYGGQAANSQQMAQQNYDQGNQARKSGMMLGGYLGEKSNWGMSKDKNGKSVFGWFS